MEFKFLLSFCFIAGSQVSLSQSIVRHFKGFVGFPTDLFWIDFDRLPIRGNGSRKIFALRIQNPELQIRGTELPVEMHRALQQRLDAR